MIAADLVGTSGEDSILTIQEVADWLKVRPRQVRRLGVPALDLGHKTIRYRRSSVQRWLDELQTENRRK